jgi:ADP-ribose pyrophosphatase YjhB (NUDIX family)
MKSRVIVVGVIEKDEKIPLGRKPDNIGPYPNTWHLPGGGVDLENETLEEALKREMKEEAGIEISNIETIGFDEDEEADKKGELTHYIFLDFKAVCASENFKAGDDLNFLQWVEKSKLKDFNLNKPTKKILHKLNLV